MPIERVHVRAQRQKCELAHGFRAPRAGSGRTRYKVQSFASHKCVWGNHAIPHARVQQQPFVASHKPELCVRGEQIPQQLIAWIWRGRTGDRFQHDRVLRKIGQNCLHLGDSKTMQLAQMGTNQDGAVFREQRLGHDERKRCDQHVVENARHVGHLGARANGLMATGPGSARRSG